MTGNSETNGNIEVNPELVLTILQTRGQTDRLLGEQVRSAIFEAALATVTAGSPDDPDRDDEA